MFLTGFPAAVFATNCYVIATAPGQECLIVDPGIGVLDDLAEVLREHRLKPAAVLLTHGHLDHTYSVTPVCGSQEAPAVIPAVIHADDAYRLADPFTTLGPELRAMLEQQFGAASGWQSPPQVRTMLDGDLLSLAGLSVRVIHAPGHTEGSVMFALDDVPSDLSSDSASGRASGWQSQPARSTVLSGDVLFAGGIGRTDLPGGDDAAMANSLRQKVLTLPDDALVLPGHGPATMMGRERATNPYLARAAAGG